jgi:hypothetical protein
MFTKKGVHRYARTVVNQSSSQEVYPVNHQGGHRIHLTGFPVRIVRFGEKVFFQDLLYELYYKILR